MPFDGGAPIAPARLKTQKSENGSSFRIELSPATLPRCSSDTMWLHEQLADRGIKAYKPTVSVNDPKQRKPANEMVDWCQGDGLKLWSTTEHRYVESLLLS